LVKSRGITGDEKADLDVCLELMASNENTTLPNSLPDVALEGLVDQAADSDESGESDDEGMPGVATG
jgi:hypothetical protein